MTSGCLYPCCFNISPRYCACATVRGKPSNTKPCAQSGCSMRAATIFSTSESGTSSPRSISGLAFAPSGVPLAMFSRNMSPVERCGTPYFLASSFAWVPFPAPGGPRKITARSNLAEGRASSAKRSEEHTSELQSRQYLVCRLLLEKKKHKSKVQASQRRRWCRCVGNDTGKHVIHVKQVRVSVERSEERNVVCYDEMSARLESLCRR